jgi:hypothetical protein
MRAADYARPYLMWGEVLRNVKVNTVADMPYDQIVADPGNLGSLNWIYTSSYPEIPLVLSSAWGSIYDSGEQKIALALINWHEDNNTIDYTFRFDDYGLSKGTPYDVYQLDESGSTLVDTVYDDFTRVDSLEARSIMIYVIEEQG